MGACQGPPAGFKVAKGTLGRMGGCQRQAVARDLLQEFKQGPMENGWEQPPRHCDVSQEVASGKKGVCRAKLT